MTTSDYFAIVAALIVVAGIALLVFNFLKGAKKGIEEIKLISQSRVDWKPLFIFVVLAVALVIMFASA